MGLGAGHRKGKAVTAPVSKPEALWLAECLDDGCSGPTILGDSAAELRRQHARIIELERQIEAVGAGGASVPTPLAEIESIINDAAIYSGAWDAAVWRMAEKAHGIGV